MHGSKNVLPQAVVALYCVCNIRLCQNHQEIVTEIHGIDSLGEGEATAVQDILIYKVCPWGAGRLVPIWRQRYVDPFGDTVERVGKKDRHYAGP